MANPVQPGGRKPLQRPSVRVPLKIESLDDDEPATAAPTSADPGTPVNKLSNAVNPKKQYPLHFDFLMRDLFQRGQVPEHWQIVAAEEVRLDEMHMDVAFTLLDKRTNAVIRRRVEVQGGRLARICDS